MVLRAVCYYLLPFPEGAIAQRIQASIISDENFDGPVARSLLSPSMSMSRTT